MQLIILPSSPFFAIDVAGIAAAIRAANPGLSAYEVRDQIVKDATLLGIQDPHGEPLRVANIVGCYCGTQGGKMISFLSLDQGQYTNSFPLQRFDLSQEEAVAVR